MRYLSVFSGIEAASVAWHGLPLQPAAFAEIEPFCCAVLRERFPGVRNLGDVRQINRSIFNDGFELMVGGSPCQNFSGAGDRKGLDGENSKLAYEYIRLAGEYRPRWLLWENVKGALSTGGGVDYRKILQSLEGLGYGLAWRVLDAQYFGLAQRRERLFVIGYLGDWRPAAAVLFDGGGRPADSEPAREARQAAERSDNGGAVAYSWHGQDGSLRPLTDVCCTVTRRWGTGGLNAPLTIAAGELVRTITPREAERLMGFPDDWTAITYRGRPASKSARFRALGNSMAVPVMAWLGARIAAVDSLLRAKEQDGDR